MAYPTRGSSSRASPRQWSLLNVLFALIAIIAFVATLSPAGSPVGGVMAEEAATQSRSEYGDVIGIDLGTT